MDNNHKWYKHYHSRTSGAPLQPDNLVIVYLAHPFTGNMQANLRRVEKIAQNIITLSLKGSFSHFYAPLIPHFLFSVFNEERNPEIRPITEALSSRLVQTCDELWIVSYQISRGMQLEIQAANDAGIPIKKWPEILKLLPQIEDALSE